MITFGFILEVTVHSKNLHIFKNSTILQFSKCFLIKYYSRFQVITAIGGINVNKILMITLKMLLFAHLYIGLT